MNIDTPFLHNTHKRPYLLCKRLKLLRTTNCTTNNIKCVRTNENRQIKQIRKKMRVNYSKAKDLFGFKYAFYKHTRLSVLEKIKNKKKFSENNFYSNDKIFRKNFLIWQRSRWRPNRGCVPSAHRAEQYRHVTDVSRLYYCRIPSVGPRVVVRWSACFVFVLYLVVYLGVLSVHF